MFIDIGSGVGIPCALRHIGEGQLHFDLPEGDLDFHPPGGHLEGVLVAALMGQVDFFALAVGDRQGVQLVALVGNGGNGHSLPLFGIAPGELEFAAGDPAGQCDGVGGVAGAAAVLSHGKGGRNSHGCTLRTGNCDVLSICTNGKPGLGLHREGGCLASGQYRLGESSHLKVAGGCRLVQGQGLVAGIGDGHGLGGGLGIAGIGAAKIDGRGIGGNAVFRLGHSHLAVGGFTAAVRRCCGDSGGACGLGGNFAVLYGGHFGLIAAPGHIRVSGIVGCYRSSQGFAFACVKR